LAFYYSDKTTIVMLKEDKITFYKTEFNECKEDSAVKHEHQLRGIMPA